MDDIPSFAALIDSATSKIQQLQHAFVELESHSAISLNMKWKELEEHFHGLEKSLKKRFDKLEDEEEKEYVTKVAEDQEMLEKQEASVVAKELALREWLQEKRDAALCALFDKYKIYSPMPIAECEGVGNGMANAASEDNFDFTPAKPGLEIVYPAENGNAHMEHSSELVKLCEEMDTEGLHKFISDNWKNLSSIGEEVLVA